MDRHFLHAPLEKNMPVLMGLLGVWNISFMGYKTRTILPYAEALLKFPAHIQQVRCCCSAEINFSDIEHIRSKKRNIQQQLEIAKLRVCYE